MEQKQVKQKNTFLALLCLILAAAVLTVSVLVILELTAPPEQTPEALPAAELPELTVNVSDGHDAEDRVVETSYLTLRYPYAFSDLIQVSPATEDSLPVLRFSAQIDGKSYPLYTLSFNREAGVLLGTVKLEGVASPVKVYAQTCQETGFTDEDSRLSFLAAQETINQVIESLADNAHFTPAS